MFDCDLLQRRQRPLIQHPPRRLPGRRSTLGFKTHRQRHRLADQRLLRLTQFNLAFAARRNHAQRDRLAIGRNRPQFQTCAVDCVGFEARGHGHDGVKSEAPATVLNSLMGVVRVAGKIGIPGLYVTEDPGAVDAAAKMGSLSIRFGLGWAKSHSFHTGQTPVMKYNRQLMQAIMWDRINIAEVVGVQVISLDQAPEGYGEFDAGVPKKFVIDPHKLFSAA